MAPNDPAKVKAKTPNAVMMNYVELTNPLNIQAVPPTDPNARDPQDVFKAELKFYRIVLLRLPVPTNIKPNGPDASLPPPNSNQTEEYHRITQALENYDLIGKWREADGEAASAES